MRREISLFILILGLFFNNSIVASEVRGEYEVKANYLLTFLKYTECPGTETQPLVISVLGKNPFGKYLQKFHGKKFNKRLVKVNYLKSLDEALKIQHHHILFVCSDLELRQKVLLGQLTAKSTLTIADNKWFLSSGGMISFVLKGDKIRYKINHKVIAANKVEISSQVLRLALNKEGEL
jgi:hypothetical protein